MKFARYLLALERDAPPRWNGKFIRYKQLKKKLKLCRTEGSPAGAVIPEREQEFFDALRNELAATNRHFQSEAARTVTAFRRTMRGSHFLCCFIPLRPSGPRQCADLADRAYWCRKYARANAVALRKILKKHDKLCGTDNGRRFLQECWSSSSQEAGVGLFLHSPLLDELKAIQDVLQRRAEAAALGDDVAEHDAVLASPSAGAATEAGAAGKRPGPKAAAGAPASLELAVLPAGTAPQQSSASAAVGACLEPPEAEDAQQQQQRRQQATAQPSMEGTHSGGVALGTAESVANSFTSPSLRAQREDGLASIFLDPACMLDSSEVEWCGIGGEAQRLLSAAAAARRPPWDALDGPLMLPQRRQAAQGGERGQQSGQRGGMPDRERGSGEGDPDAPVQRPPSAAESKRSRGEEEGGGAAGNSAGDSGVGPAVGPFSDEDLRCPICLDILYKPVGLGCGHKFCRPCALTAAGFGDTIGAFHNIVPYIPDRTPCPHCRQKNVYHSAVMLKEVGALIREKYPEEWEKRKEEDRQQVRMRAAAPEREAFRAAMRTNIYDVLLGTAPE